MLDSGQVTGLNDDEILETMVVLFYMSTTLEPKAQLSIFKVRIGHEGYSVMLKVTRAKVTSDKNFTNELMTILANEKVRRESQCDSELEESKESFLSPTPVP